MKPFDHRLEVHDALLKRPKPIVDHRRRAFRRLGYASRALDCQKVPGTGRFPLMMPCSLEAASTNDDASQVEHRSRVIVLEAREPRLQLLDSRELELSEQGDAGGLTLVGDVKLERHFD